MADKVRYLGVEGRAMKPTLRHRPAIWENMLGTVYAMNDARQIKYFDYNHEAAIAFAGVAEKKDVRIARNPRAVNWTGAAYGNKGPRLNQLALWVERADV